MQPAARGVLPVQTGTHFGQHAGLILTRYLENAVQKGAEQAKQNLFAASRKALRQEPLQQIYRKALQRWLFFLPADARRMKFNTASRLIIGLGGESVTETGLTLHHTYGVPYLPGSALKGVAARYARQVWGASDPSWHPDTKPLDQPNHFRTIFGTTDEGGLVEFLDGWITDTSLKNCLVDDIMTPHHGDYYMADDDQVREPTDFDSPIPVPFLAVRGAFQVAICRRDPRLPSEWLDIAQKALIRALSELGIGGKTNAGYGRLIAEPDRNPAPHSTETSPSEEAPAVDVELEVVEVYPSGQLEVITLDASQVGTIANFDEVPQRLRVAERRLIGQLIPGSEPAKVQFRFVRAASERNTD